MRIHKGLMTALLAFSLAGCLGGLIASAGTRVLLAILAPMVGLDPNAGGLFQQPIIRDRMQAFLGDQYQPVMQLIATADKLQQEGPLYFVVSRYTPIPDIAEKAGFVWNSDTNQMAVMLVAGGSPTILAEKVLLQNAGQTVAEAVPVWPAELQSILEQDTLRRQALEAATATATERLRQQALEQLDAEIRANESATAVQGR